MLLGIVIYPFAITFVLAENTDGCIIEKPPVSNKTLANIITVGGKLVLVPTIVMQQNYRR